jgi:LMBR1 domain-containing protein 1
VQSCVYRWFSRPQKTITKTQYIEKAKAIGARAKELAGAALDIKKKEEDEGPSRKLRTQTKALSKELLLLEDDERELEKLYPQVCPDSTHLDAF